MSLTFIDLFAGCGGFSLGLEKAGMKGILHLEIDKWASETLEANFPKETVLCADIRDVPSSFIEQYKGVDVIVGGPPCQGFSVAGASQFGIVDPRNELVLWYLKWVEILLPKVAVIENVPQIFTKKDRDGLTVLDIVKGRLSKLGYEITPTQIVASDYGVPQNRTRAFILCSRVKGINLIPPKTHGQPSSFDLFSENELHPYVTVGDALLDLPQIEAGTGTDEISVYDCDAKSSYQQLMRKGSSGVVNHVAMKHTQRLIERFKNIKPGQSLKDVPAEFGQIKKNSVEINKKPFKSNNYRLALNKPSLTIPASFQSLFIHPILNRNLTAREAARLMSFPDSYVFKGKRTTMSWEKNLSQYNQIGNSVCPLVAEAIGRQIMSQIPASVGKDFRAPRLLEEHLKENLVEEGVFKKNNQELLRKIKDTFLSLHPDFIMKKIESKEIPIEAVPLAILVATERNCSICSRKLPPQGSHLNTIPFLIGKEDTASLKVTENDHGLDYHLRFLLGINYQIGHNVGRLIEELGYGKVCLVVNPRTGRQVRGLTDVHCPKWLEELRNQFVF